MIAGSKIVDGTMRVGATVRVMRPGEEGEDRACVGRSIIATVRNHQSTVVEVRQSANSSLNLLSYPNQLIIGPRVEPAERDTAFSVCALDFATFKFADERTRQRMWDLP
eukprot:SAG11_NODE_24066_length_378_cov_1.853047_1_plen_109_part_00